VLSGPIPVQYRSATIRPPCTARKACVSPRLAGAGSLKARSSSGASFAAAAAPGLASGHPVVGHGTPAGCAGRGGSALTACKPFAPCR